MDKTMVLVSVVIGLALFFAFTNGFNDSANIVATMISTRALSPGAALWLASVFEFIGAVFLGTAVARMIAGGIIDPAYLDNPRCVWIIIAALIGAISWNICSYMLALPSSSSHALLGGLIGALVSAEGLGVLIWKNLFIIGFFLVMAPIAAIFFSYLFTRGVYFVGEWMTPKANSLFRKLQIVSSIALALSHGTNDAQKAMGMIMIALVSAGMVSRQPEGLVIPFWVIFASAAILSLGVGTGARRIIHTLGMKIYRIRPIHGFCSQTTSAIIIYTAAFFGLVVSTAETVSSSIAGAGAADRIKKVKWDVFADFIAAWSITMPVAAIIASGCFFVFRALGAA